MQTVENTTKNDSETEVIDLVRLDESSIREAKGILYQAYHFDPTFKYLFDFERPGYDQRVRATLRELIELHFAKNQEAIGVTVNNLLVAVAFIGSPHVRLNLADQINWRLRMMLTAGLASTRRYIDYHEQISALFPKDQHHELPLMGVLPKYQNQGIGTTLIKAVEHLCAENPKSAGLGLDTGNARYLDFYKSLGYEQVGEIELESVKEVVLFKSSDKLTGRI